MKNKSAVSFGVISFCAIAGLICAKPVLADDKVDDAAEFRMNGNYSLSPSNDVNGSDAYGIDTTILSSPYHAWRIFAGESFNHEIEPVGEGQIGYNRATAGASYQGDAYSFDLAPTFNTHNSRQDVGFAGDGSWAFAKNWSLDGNVQIISRDTPLRALNAGINSNSYDFGVSLAQPSARDLRVAVGAMTFTDNNFRSTVTIDDAEHFYVGQHFSLDGVATVYSTGNSKDENRPYYNPKQDVLGQVGVRVTQPLYKKDEYTYDHSLTLKPGVYWQDNYGTDGAYEVRYDQSLHIAERTTLGAGVDFMRQTLDGAPENSIAFSINLTQKF